jgi:pyridoxal phosphate enzyme (YggS family)
MSIAENISRILHEIEPYHSKLIAVSKTHPAAAVREAFEAGQLDFGENKVQEIQDKKPLLPSEIHWHLIGHLQTNKVKYIAPHIHLIHSVDSLKLLEEINKEGKKNNRIIPCLLQVHIAQEETKFGADAQDVQTWFSNRTLDAFEHVTIKGFMGMASFTAEEQKIRQEFRQLKKLFDESAQHYQSQNTDWKELCMGMSADYKIALDEGSTMVRVGSAIFGNRTYQI